MNRIFTSLLTLLLLLPAGMSAQPRPQQGQQPRPQQGQQPRQRMQRPRGTFTLDQIRWLTAGAYGIYTDCGDVRGTPSE